MGMGRAFIYKQIQLTQLHYVFQMAMFVLIIFNGLEKMVGLTSMRIVNSLPNGGKSLKCWFQFSLKRGTFRNFKYLLSFESEEWKKNDVHFQNSM